MMPACTAFVGVLNVLQNIVKLINVDTGPDLYKSRSYRRAIRLGTVMQMNC